MRSGSSRPFVEIAQHDDMLATGDKAIHDPAHFGRLTQTPVPTTPRLRLEMIHQNVNNRVVWRPYPILRAIAAEDDSDGVDSVDMRSNRLDLQLCAGHYPDIDSTLIIPIDQHDVLVTTTEQFIVEPDKGGSILRFDYPNDIGVDIGDDPRRHPCTGLIGCFRRQFDPSDP